MKRCNKCKCSTKDGASFIEGGDQFHFCKFCSLILEKANSGNLIHRFMQKNASEDETIQMSWVQRNMLRAKELRSTGKSLWSQK